MSDRETRALRRRGGLSAVVAGLLLLGPGSAVLAQDTPGNSPGQPRATQPQPPCSPGRDDQSTTGSGDLSKRLSESGGVLCPPSDVDPHMQRSAPEGGGRMPVIPPPGSPGGDPQVKPKQ